MAEIQSNIQEFFKNKSVFVTGGTGFLGKLIVNKLIRSCPQINHIYLLVRDKKGKNAHERLEDMFNMPIFKDMDALALKKISALRGDCSQADLGLSVEDQNMLIKEVNVIFHSAATVRFDERLDIAIGINVIGAREIVKLAHKVDNLASYLHVSTAFSNCHNKRIEEKFYNLPYNYEKLIHLYKTKSSNILEKMKPFLLGPMPNTYVMTKAAAEQLIKREAKGLPVTIVRPAIVIATANEPLPGWIDNLYGPTGIVTGVMTGIIKSLPCDVNAVTDLVPADLTVNALIAASWDTRQVRHMTAVLCDDAITLLNSHSQARRIESIDYHHTDDPRIYNFVSSPENPLTWGIFSTTLMYYILHRPTAKAMWYPTLIMNSSTLLHKLTVLVLHYLPAFLLDLVFICTGNKLRLVEQYKKIGRFTDILEYFSTREWIFCNKNVQGLWNSLSNDDQTLFPFDIKKMHWEEYLDTYHKGIMTFLLKEGPDKLPEARKRLRGLYICHMIFKGAVYIGLMMLLWVILKRIFLA